MKFELCKKCNTCHWNHQHCPPKFLVKSPIWDGDAIDDNWNTIHSYGVASAAEKYVEKVDDEFSCLRESITVWVQNPSEQRIYIVKVKGESDITYHTDADDGTDIADFKGAK